MKEGQLTTVLDEPYVCVDVETDGMNYTHGHVIEVAAIRVENGEITREFTTLINPGVSIPYFITNLTGITTNDVQDAPSFADIADELMDILDGATFVAHNVRFDYSFLKQEFRRAGIDFEPKQLCTVKLSRKLYPDQTSHKLSSLIARHSFTYNARHRAYDDAHVLWQFLNHAQEQFSPDIIHAAISHQIKRPSIPKHLDVEAINVLPTGPGVYMFDDDKGMPLYIGKSVNIRRRVQSHFTRDSEEYREFKISQSVHAIRYESTNGELEALLLEAHLVKTEQPLYNRRLRRVRTLTALRQHINSEGYITITTDQLTQVVPDQFDSILALYDKRGAAKTSLLTIVKTFDLCPKLAGLEKAKGACFSYQLGRCKGACIGKEPSESYNRRLLLAFEHKRIQSWPYDGPVVVQEMVADAPQRNGFIVDQWSIIGKISQQEDFAPVVTQYEAIFDYDSYKILRSFMLQRGMNIAVTPYTAIE
ncbi:MAG TPA: exonuclease domain-containing protein [Candidatus Saccharimonadales bacterium]|jgi:DNA polymerase-3 subunit epsilon|nr:exonuclease domain-containing protein [Candidatus Saccharimonadales bacterium]